MRHRSWMIVSALLFGLAQGKADDSLPPWAEGPAHSWAIRSDALYLADLLRSGGHVELGSGFRLFARKVVNDRFVQVTLESRDAKGQLVFTAHAADARITVDHRAAKMSIRLHDGDGKTADGASEVTFTEREFALDVPPALMRNLDAK
jgi:hypothetical protein